MEKIYAHLNTKCATFQSPFEYIRIGLILLSGPLKIFIWESDTSFKLDYLRSALASVLNFKLSYVFLGALRWDLFEKMDSRKVFK